MITSNAQQVALRIQDIDDGPGADLEACLRGLQRLLTGYYRLLECLDATDLGNDTAIAVTRLALHLAEDPYLVLLCLVVEGT